MNLSWLRKFLTEFSKRNCRYEKCIKKKKVIFIQYLVEMK